MNATQPSRKSGYRNIEGRIVKINPVQSDVPTTSVCVPEDVQLGLRRENLSSQHRAPRSIIQNPGGWTVGHYDVSSCGNRGLTSPVHTIESQIVDDCFAVLK